MPPKGGSICRAAAAGCRHLAATGRAKFHFGEGQLPNRSSRTGPSAWRSPTAARGRQATDLEVRSRRTAVVSSRKPRQIGVPERCRAAFRCNAARAPGERLLSGSATGCSRPEAEVDISKSNTAKRTFVPPGNRPSISNFEHSQRMARENGKPIFVAIESRPVEVHFRDESPPSFRPSR